MALAAYRSLLRSARIAFEGDAPTLSAALTQIRGGFREKASLDPDSKDVPAAIHYAQDVAKLLRENVVQGRKASQADDTYRLRIHEHIERGDNDSVKMAGVGATGGGCGCK